jgi:hypothetical protein
MNKEWLKFTAGVIGFVAVALLISYVIQSPAQAELDSIERNPGNDKVIEDTVNEDPVTVDRVTELGTAMKLWAIGFGAEAEQSAVSPSRHFLMTWIDSNNQNFGSIKSIVGLRANRIWPTRERALNNCLKL